MCYLNLYILYCICAIFDIKLNFKYIKYFWIIFDRNVFV